MSINCSENAESINWLSNCTGFGSMKKEVPNLRNFINFSVRFNTNFETSFNDPLTENFWLFFLYVTIHDWFMQLFEASRKHQAGNITPLTPLPSVYR